MGASGGEKRGEGLIARMSTSGTERLLKRTMHTVSTTLLAPWTRTDEIADDPYLGHSASPYPPPQNIYPPAPYSSNSHRSPEQPSEYAFSSNDQHQQQQMDDPFARSASSLSSYAADPRYR